MVPINKRTLASGIALLTLAFLSWYGIGCGTDEVRQSQALSPTPVPPRSLTGGSGAAQKTTTAAIRWHYPNPSVPENWASLSDEFRTCAEGVEQSPVNLAGYTSSDAGPIAFSYASAATAVRNNGHTVHLDYGGGDSIAVDGRRYELLGIHSHSPGEHLLDGEHFAAELHLVHRDSAGNLAVVGLLFRIGDHSPIVQNLLGVAPDVGALVDLNGGPAAVEYVPNNLDHYGYDGSLTTPPCTEGVRWIVMRHIGTVSQDQVNGLQELSRGPNNRSVQPLGERHIVATASVAR